MTIKRRRIEERGVSNLSLKLVSSNRRQFLRRTMGFGGWLLALAAGFRPQGSASAFQVEPRAQNSLPELPVEVWPGGRNIDDFILHVREPLAMETRRSAFGMSVITPISKFYVRNNLPAPSPDILANPDAWEIEMSGVASPKAITVGDLKRMSFETTTCVVQCSGNGRKFSAHPASGSQWEVGAAGCAMWTGVRVSQLAREFGGPVAGSRFMTGTGGEQLPEAIDPLSVIVERSIPIEKGLDDCILAWEMNGAPVPLLHGGPLRLIVPGYFGINHIKYVKKLAFTQMESQAAIQRTGYRFRPVSVAGDPNQPSMWEMNVKSWINGPGADGQPIKKGRTKFYGVAFSGSAGIRQVDWTMDGGVTWQVAEIYGPELPPSAWRTFSFDAVLGPGRFTVASRATDEAGSVQPRDLTENERGYGNNAWRDHALTVRVVDEIPREVRLAPAGTPGRISGNAPARTSALSDEAESGRRAMVDADPPCGSCHTVSEAQVFGAVGPNLDVLRPTQSQVVAAVTNGLGIMPAYSGKLSEEKIQQIARYIFEVTR